MYKLFEPVFTPPAGSLVDCNLKAYFNAMFCPLWFQSALLACLQSALESPVQYAILSLQNVEFIVKITHNHYKKTNNQATVILA